MRARRVSPGTVLCAITLRFRLTPFLSPVRIACLRFFCGRLNLTGTVVNSPRANHGGYSLGFR